MEEPTRYKKDSMKHAKIPYWLILKRYGGSLAAISATWFLYDIITYACFHYYPRIKFTPLFFRYPVRTIWPLQPNYTLIC